MAITLDTSSSSHTTNGTVVTISTFTVGNFSDRLLCVVVNKWDPGNTDNVQSITWNGDSLSLAVEKDATAEASNNMCELWYMVAPDVGNFNLVVTYTQNQDTIDIGILSLYGVSQVGQPDATNSGLTNTTSGLNATVTTVADNSWAVTTVQTNNNGGVNLDSGGTEFMDLSASFNVAGYSGPKTPAGVVTHAYSNGGGSEIWLYVAASFSPSSAATALTSRRMRLGIGS